MLLTIASIKNEREISRDSLKLQVSNQHVFESSHPKCRLGSGFG